MKNKYGLFFALLVFAVVSFPAICFSEKPDSKTWEPIGNDTYINKKIMKKSPDFPLIWTYKTVTNDVRQKRVDSVKMYDPEKSVRYKTYHHDVVLWEIDCNKKLLRVKEYIDFDAEGKIIDRYKYGNNEWGSIAPQSMGEILHKKACPVRNETLRKKK